MTNSNNLPCPKRYDTAGLFNGFYNEDPNEKCNPYFTGFTISSKLTNGATTKIISDNTYPFREAGQTGINNQFALGGITKGNMSRIRQVGRYKTPMTIGNGLNDNKFNNALNEGFREHMTTNIPEFTTEPIVSSTGKTSAEQPQLRAPDEIYNRRVCDGGNINNIKNNITNPLTAFKDGVIYSMTFGSKDHESFCPGMGYEMQQNTRLAGKIIGGIIMIIIIWFALSFIVSAILYGLAAANGGCFCPCDDSSISTVFFVPNEAISKFTEEVSRQRGGNKNGFVRFFNTVGEVMVSPFKFASNKLTGGNRRRKAII